jgi:CRISPR-associated protein Cmr3
MSDTWTALRLTPLDTLFFREPRPFTAGEQTEGRSVFPPTALTLQGMLRSRLLATHAPRALGGNVAKLDKAVSDVVGELGGQPASLRLRGPWLLNGDEWLLPAPGDLVVKGGEKGVAHSDNAPQQAACLCPAGKTHASLPGALHALAPPDGFGTYGHVEGWLTWSAYEQALAGCALDLRPRENWFRPRDLWEDETRPGVGINRATNAAQDHLLYFAHHVRLKSGVALGIQVSGLGTLGSPAGQLAALGGEARAVQIDAAPSPPWHGTPAPQGSRLKLVLTQPAWFQAGWHPAWMKTGARGDAHGHAERGDGRAAWHAAHIDRALRLGGWDLVKRVSKPLRAYVPAGSVYHLEAAGLADVFAALHDSAITESPQGEAFDKLGLGHALLGVW